MAKGISLHIGLNQLDTQVWGKQDNLKGCINDANAMLALAKAQGYTTSYVLENADATVANTKMIIQQALSELSKGDIFLFTYSGHGTQDDNKDADSSDQDDQLDEALCLYDFMLLDDELAALWSQAAAGVRILMVIDSCHSGTMSRDANSAQVSPIPAARSLPLENRLNLLKTRAGDYHQAKIMARNTLTQKPIQASICLLAACHDKQLSRDGDKHGLFTEYLLKVWNKGKFNGTYQQLVEKTSQQMQVQIQQWNSWAKQHQAELITQDPQHSVIGLADPDFDKQKPFTI